jgi:endonuclease/exonuclease/phosphatase family metal-dependent hydrolase
MFSGCNVRKSYRGLSIALVAILLIGAVTTPAWAVKIATYNLLNYNSGREAYFKTILNAMQPDVLVVQEINSQAAVTYFLNNVLNGTGGPGGYSAATFQLSPDSSNALYYRTATITYAGASDHTYLATSPRYTDRWRLGLSGGDVYFYVYSMHLKAGNTSPDADSRLAQCTLVRNDANNLPAGTHFIEVGDFNLYDSTEDSYNVQLTGSLADNDGRAFDPISTPGAWHANSSFSHIHTQCPHNNNANPPPGSVGGGMDDRFDFLLISAALKDGQGLDYVSGSYKAYGNDGLHFNNDINDPPTIPEGQTIADALHGASDHLPVVLELTAPPAIQVAPSSLPFGTILVGTGSPTNQKILTVTNAALPPALNLTYQFSTIPTGYTVVGGAGPFSLTPQASRQHTIELSTATAGYYNANLSITNNSVPNPKIVYCSGTVKRHAVPSTESGSQVLTAPLDFGPHMPGGFTDQPSLVYNQGYTTLQSPLQVYDYSIAGADAARFSLTSFVPANVTTTPASFAVHFDDSGAAFGVYTAALQFSTRDDTALLGWTNLPAVTYNLTATVGIRGDMNAGGVVETSDIPGFVSVLLNPAGATADQRWLADVFVDGVNDGKDVPPFVDALLGTP